MKSMGTRMSLVVSFFEDFMKMRSAQKNIVAVPILVIEPPTLIGSGGYASVTKSYSPAHKQYVVTKKFVIRPDAMERFASEKKILLALDHPNIPKFIKDEKSHTSLNNLSLTLTFCPGLDLFHYITESFPFSRQERKAIAKELCLTLQYAHTSTSSTSGSGVFHRDVKPENVIYDETTKRVYLIDWGLAEFIADIPSVTSCAGSLEYVAPEVISDEKHYGVENDVWSVCVVLYTLMSGVLPYEQKDTFRQRAEAVIKMSMIYYPLKDEGDITFFKSVFTHWKKRPTLQMILEDRWFTLP